MNPPDPSSVSRAAKRLAEEKQAAILSRARLGAFKKHRDGTYGKRSRVGKSNQIGVPVDIVRRWGGIGSNVVVLDLDWAILVVPEDEARVLFSDLNL